MIPKMIVQFLDENGEVVAEHQADPCQPSVWNAPPGGKFVGAMPANSSDNKNNGTYELFRMTFQPVVRVQRPNGWQEPPPNLSAPVGLPQGFPTSFPKQPPPFGGYGTKQSGPPPFGADPSQKWSQFTPTITPNYTSRG